MATKTQIELSALNSGANRLVIHERIELASVEVFGFPEALDVKMDIERQGDVLDIFGAISGTLQGNCDRCLEEYTTALAVAVDEHLTIDAPGDPLGESNVIHDGRLDVGDLVRQLVHAELPFVSLCRPNCAGLCTHCGANRNEGSCSCEAVTKGDHGEP